MIDRPHQAPPADRPAGSDARARAEDSASLESRYRDLHPLLARYLRAQEPAVADKLLTVTGRTVARRLAQSHLDGEGLGPFAFGVAHQLVVQQRRERAARKPLATNDGRHLTVGIEAVDGLGPQGALARLVAPLTVEQADVILLSVVGSLNVDQIARILGRSSISVRAAQRRALRRLGRDRGIRALAP